MKARVSFTEVALVLSIIAFTHLIPDAPWIIESNSFFQDSCPDVLSGSWFRIVIQQRVLPGFKTGKGSRFFLMLGGQNWTQQFDRMKSPCSEKNTVTKQMNKYKRIKFLLLWKMLLSILDIAGTCVWSCRVKMAHDQVDATFCELYWYNWIIVFRAESFVWSKKLVWL